MNNFKIVNHAPGAPGLRHFGLGPNLTPHQGIKQLIRLFNKNTFWAENRSKISLSKMLSNSDVVISVWVDRNLIGFGRATTDQIFRAVLWDIVVDKDYQVNGIGRKIVQTILKNKIISKVEKVYLMTTHCEEFYRHNGFMHSDKQSLMVYNHYSN